ncbi:MAG TPA: hydrogenase maturation protease [Pirellulales bacterium]|jgi:hydrogenase maturation protease|nr:hydrogenase maturation protease [Pirellulales bacterium]
MTESDFSGILLIGLGSPHGDDQVGWRVAEEISRLVPTLPTACVASPIEILDRLDDVKRLVICDACRSAGVVGGIYRWQWPDRQLAPIEFSGTHDVELSAVLKLASALGRLPKQVTIWGIEIESSQPGQPLSASLAQEVARIARTICEDFHAT